MKKNAIKRMLSLVLTICMIAAYFVPGVSAVTEDFDAMSLSQIIASSDKLTWVVAGDSITHNGSWSEGMNSWGEWIEQYIYDIGRTGDTVVVNGWGGAKLDDFQPNSSTMGMGTDDFITKYNPDVVFIKLGMNNRPDNKSTFTTKYKAILDEIYRAGEVNGKAPKVVLLTSTPLSGENATDLDYAGQDSVNRQVAWMNEMVASYNSSKGKHIQVVDLRNAFVAERDVLGDDWYSTFFFGPSDGAIHPNAAGQYLIFKTVAKTCGLYNASMPIFQQDYRDLYEGYLYVDGTSTTYEGSYGPTVNDSVEMNKDMPALEQQTIKLLASIDFDSSNGTFVGGATYDGATRVDLTNGEVMDDPLTLAEVQSLDREYTLVFRARLDPSNQNNQPVLLISSNGVVNWDNALSLGVQGKGDQMYYEIRKGGADQTNSTNTFTIDANKTIVNSGWHTIAIVQKTDGFDYYVDGVLKATKDIKLKDGVTIGSLFANAADFQAHIGSYAEKSGTTYQLDGDLDFYQLYKGALSAEQIAQLHYNSGADVAKEMNKTMPTATGAGYLAAKDFTSDNGTFVGGSGYASATIVDLTDANVMDDALTLEEVQAMGREFTLVVRAKLASNSFRAHQNLLMISPTGTYDWFDAISLGGPGSGHNLYYEVRQTKQELTNSTNTIALAATTPKVTDQWHTLAIVQRTDGLDYYIDGKLAESKSVKLNDGLTFGGLFAEATDFAAHVGSFSESEAGTYALKAKVDYYQFYGSALTADQVLSLGSGAAADADEMNGTMPTVALGNDNPLPIAAIDFDSTNGVFTYNNTDIHAGTVDLTDSTVMDDALTLAEVQALGKEYSVVFRFRSNVPSGRSNLPIIYIADSKSGGFQAQKNMVLMGMPGTDNIYGQTKVNGTQVSTLSTSTTKFGDLRTAMNDGKWHTVAIVQSASSLIYYVDGTAYTVNNNNGQAITISTDIGSGFANATADKLDAVLGRYGVTDANWKTQGTFDFYQMYDKALTSAQVQALSASGEEVSGANWSSIDHDNAVWAIAGDDSINNYGGTVANRSLLRFIDNTARNCESWTNRDIRVLPFANSSYDPVYLNNNFSSVFGGHNYSVFMLIPSVSSASLADYKAALEGLMEKNKDKVLVLWTPLASNDAFANDNITLYADVVREVAAANSDILFFDANKFMNEKMEANATLKRNWFETTGISPLAAHDLARAFYTHAGVSSFTESELKNHNLRLSGDTRARKTVARDYIAPTVTVSGSSITVDASALVGAYNGLTNLRVLVMPEVGFGTFSESNWTKSFTGNTVTFESPWANPVVTVLGDLGGYTYRFKDIPTAAAAGNPGVDYYTDGLTGLEVVGAPAIGFEANKTSYDVTLYQYQRNVQIRAEGGKNLAITVNGQTVGAGKLSQKISVNGNATVTVKVSGGASEQTYTLNLTRPANADIIITEVMQKSAGAHYDMIEIYNASGRDLDLKDYALGYKKDYLDSFFTTENKGMYPYYFTGDDQAFNDRNNTTHTYTGINAITHNSTFWTGANAVEEPESIPFPANSTMILWVKYGGADKTYDTLVTYLNGMALTLEDGTKVVPTAEMVALAERPNGVTASGATNTGYGSKPTANTNFHLEDHGMITGDGGDSAATRSWLFILKDTAVRDTNVSVTAAGDDIISAGMFVRPTDSQDMSTQLYYDHDRGMSLVKNPVNFNATQTGAPYTSDQYSYATYTTFGAIEYWQKPTDYADTQAAVAENKTPGGVLSGDDAVIEVNITDNVDIRYVEMYVDADNDGTYETTLRKDLVLETSAKNEGVAANQTSFTYTQTLEAVTDTVKYYGIVVDAGGNKTQIGTAETPKTIEIVQPGQLKVNVESKDVAGNASAEEVEVQISLNKGTSLVNLAGTYPIKNADGDTVGQIVAGTGTATLADGEYVTVSNIPEGVTYAVTYTVPSGYEDKTDTDALTGTIGVDGIVTVSVKETLLTGSVKATVASQDAGGADVTEVPVKFTFVLEKGDAKVELEESYPVTVNGEAGTLTTKDTVEVNTRATVSVDNVPYGAVVKLVPQLPEGYELVDEVESVKVTAALQELRISIQETLLTADLTVGASVKQADGSASDKTAEIKINLTKGNAPVALANAYDVLVDGEKVGTTADTISLADGQKATVKGLPVGAAYEIRVTAANGYENVTETALSGNVAATGSVVAVAVKEKLVTGSLTVNALLKLEDGSADAVTKANVTVKLTKGNSPVALDASYRVTDGAGEQLGATANGSFTYALGNGQQLVVEGLPAGAGYTVTLELPEGFENKTTDTLTGNVAASGSALNVAMQKLLVTADLKLNADVLLENGSASSEIITVQLALAKGNSPVELAEKYDVYADGEKIGTTAEILSLSNSTELTVKGLPVGAAYTLTVTVPSGYENTTASTSGNVAQGGSSATVSAKKILVTADLTVTAAVSLENGAASTEKITVKINLTKGNSPVELAESYDVYLVNNKTRAVTGEKVGTTKDTFQLAQGESLVVADVPAGAAYAITVTTPDGYENTFTGGFSGNMDADGAQITVSAKKELVTADLEAVVNLKKEDGSADTSATATLKIVVTKGNSPVELAESYDVFVGTEKIGTTGQSLTVENGKTVTVKGLPVGTAYEVTATLPNGYDAPDAVTGSIADGENEISFNAQKNLVTADLNVSAEVRLEGGDESGAKLSVKINLTKGNSPVNLAQSYDVFVGTEKIGTTADTLEVGHRETITVKGLPVGTAYAVAVTAPEGYENTTTGATSGNVSANGASVTVSVKKLLVTADLETVVNLKKEDGSADASATATLKIVVTKGNSPVELTESYDVFVGTEKIGTTGQSLTVENGAVVIVKGLPAGTAYEVTATLPEGYDAPDAVTGNIYTLWDNEVTFNAQKNLVTADLSVAATVKLEDGSAAEDKIQIEIKLTKGNSPVNLEDSYDIFLGNEKLGNTKQILSIADGEVFTVKDLPVGAAYEIIATPADGYTDTTTGATSGNITANGARVNLSAEKNLVTADLSISADVTLENGDASTDKVNVKVQLTKGNAPVDLAASYEVYVGTNKIGTTDNTLAIADGETFTVKGLPVGAGFSLTVTAAEGYEDTTTVTSGKITANGTEITVSAKKILVTGDLKVNLQILDVTGNDASTSVKATVKITLTKGNAPVDLAKTYQILNASGVQIGTMDNGVATLELSNGVDAIIEDLPAGTGYAVTVTVPEGYEGKTVNASGNITANGAEASLKIQELVKEGQLVVSTSIKRVDGSSAGYNVKANVTITLTKDNAPVNLAASYDILDENGTKIGTTTAGTSTLALADGQQAVIKGLPEGAAYSVNVTAPSGYANNTTASTTGNIGTDSGAVAVVVNEILKTADLSVKLNVKNTQGGNVADQAVTVTVAVTKGNAPVALAASYDIVNGSGAKIGTLANGAATLNLKSGETATVKGLPQGVAYNVVVTAPEGYELSNQTATGTGNLSANATVEFTVEEIEQTPTEPSETEPSTTPTQPSETKPSGTPGTGDQSNITLFVIVMAGSLLLIAVLVIAFLVSRKGKGKYSK